MVMINQKIIWGGGPMFSQVIWESPGSTQELYSLFCSVNKARARLFSGGKKELLSGNSNVRMRVCVGVR